METETQKENMNPPAWLGVEIEARRAKWSDKEDGLILATVCRTCQSSLNSCICEAPHPDTVPIWREGQGINERLLKYLRSKRDVHAAERLVPSFTLHTAEEMSQRLTLWSPAVAPSFAGFETIALRNASLGYLVFPVDTGKKKPSILKFPQLATCGDTGLIKEWARKFPDASCGLLATREGRLFIDEDESSIFRTGYTAFTNEPFPISRTTESRPNHRQSHWIQTDYSRRRLKNTVQGKTKDGMFSLRFNNLYVLGEGSRHPSGSLYTVVVDSVAIPMPDKLVDYINSLIVDTLSVSSASVSSNSSDGTIPAKFDVILGEHGRNDGVSRYAWHVWQDETTDKDEFSEKVHAYNQAHCDPPLDDNEVEAIIKGKMDKPITGANAVIIGKRKIEETLPPIDEMKEKSLFVFKNSGDVKAATNLGFKASGVDGFELPLNFSYDRIILMDGGKRSAPFQKVSASIGGLGVISADMPSTISLESLNAILRMDAIKKTNINNPEMVTVRKDSLGQGQNPLVFKYPRVLGAGEKTDYEYVLDSLGGEEHEGWFPRGNVSLIGGPSGGSKSTFMIDLLQVQHRGEDFLFHKTFGMPYLILAADRGEGAAKRTAKRMHYDLKTTPFGYLPIADFSINNIVQEIEKRDPLPAVVFIEGCDMLVENASKMEVVAPFLDALSKIAKHYYIAIVGSVGSPKQKVGEGYVAKRDSIFGSQVWGRQSETIIAMQYPEGDDTDSRRVVSGLLRNGHAEKYKMVYKGGRLVIDNGVFNETSSVSPEVAWFRTAPNWFTIADVKKALRMSQATAYRCVEDAFTKGVLKTKRVKNGEARQYLWSDSAKNPHTGLADVALDSPKEEHGSDQKEDVKL